MVGFCAEPDRGGVDGLLELAVRKLFGVTRRSNPLPKGQELAVQAGIHVQPFLGLVPARG